MTTASLPTLADVAAEVDAALADLDLPREPSALYAPARYVLEGGGKRIRPALVLLTAEAFGGDDARRRALAPALGVEVFHNFTLVHDDIMDHSATRRGRPTVHARWDTPTAILTGDFLMGLANDLVVRTEGADAVRFQQAFYDAVTRLCEGQMLDMTYERRSTVAVDEYIGMVDRKTGALLELAFEIGALVGGAPEAVEPLRQAGRAIGRAFQIQDDLLDLTASTTRWGKPVGGDLVEGKRTFLIVSAMALATDADQEWLGAVLSGDLSQGQVPGVRDRLAALGILDGAAAEVDRYTAEAAAGLSHLPDGPSGDALRALALQLASRQL